jgi:hypothetical protein
LYLLRDVQTFIPIFVIIHTKIEDPLLTANTAPGLYPTQPGYPAPGQTNMGFQYGAPGQQYGVPGQQFGVPGQQVAYPPPNPQYANPAPSYESVTQEKTSSAPEEKTSSAPPYSM